jgi:hypothetical protein
VGPVASGFGYTGDIEKRLSDDDAVAVQGAAPWSKSYLVPAALEPSVAVAFQRTILKNVSGRRQVRSQSLPIDTLRIEAKAALGPAQIDVLDHHFVKITTLSANLAAGQTDVKVPIGNFVGRVDVSLQGDVYKSFGASAKEEGQ